MAKLSELVNIEKRINKKEDFEKPCFVLKYCPYGRLNELYPLHLFKDDGYNCKIFGHDCPVYYLAEEEIHWGNLRLKIFPLYCSMDPKNIT